MGFNVVATQLYSCTCIPSLKKEMIMTEMVMHSDKTKLFDLRALIEPTKILVARAATMHQRMMKNYDSPAVARAVDTAVLHVYEQGRTPLQAAAIFNVDANDVVVRKEFYDRIAEALDEPASKFLAEHLVQSR